MSTDSLLTTSLTASSPSRIEPRAAAPMPSVSVAESAAENAEPARPVRGWYIPCKMGVDWLIALGLFTLTAPLMGALLLLVRCTSAGPALFRQTRLGRFGKPYQMYKIRTMTHNCEAHTGAVWSGPNDSRVTRVGRFLRDAHLDELPQLINVLRCEMSLIGPRPERPELVKQIKRRLPRYPERMQIRPGVTGFAQIQHPADLDMDHVRRKLMYDLYYVRETSVLLDIRILLGTALYISGATFKALGKLLVKSHGIAAELENDDIELLDEDVELRATGS